MFQSLSFNCCRSVCGGWNTESDNNAQFQLKSLKCDLYLRNCFLPRSQVFLGFTLPCLHLCKRSARVSCTSMTSASYLWVNSGLCQIWNYWWALASETSNSKRDIVVIWTVSVQCISAFKGLFNVFKNTVVILQNVIKLRKLGIFIFFTHYT